MIAVFGDCRLTARGLRALGILKMCERKKIYRGTYSTGVGILGCFCLKYGQKSNLLKFSKIFILLVLQLITISNFGEISYKIKKLNF